MSTLDEIKALCRESPLLRGPYRVLRFVRHAPAWIDVVLGRRYYDRRRLDRLFAAGADPWGYEGSAQSAERRERILALLPRERYAAMLEVGCAEGWLTSALAARATALTAIDISTVALARARLRCASLPQVRFAEHDIVTDGVPGPFDAIVCAGVLRYVPRPRQAALRTALVDALAPGGDLLLEHTRDADPGELPGLEIHRAFRGEARLVELAHEERDRWAITLFRRRA